MIIVIIICGILYLFMIYGVIYLYYTYRKDIEEIEKRLLQLEKRIEEIKHYTYQEYKIMRNTLENEFCFYDQQIEKIIKDKEVDNMACKKGRGGRKK